LTALGAGSVDFRGRCVDLAGNERVTGVTAILLPSTPAQLVSITQLAPTPGGVVTSPITLDGGGNLVLASFKLVYDKPVTIDVTVGAGSNNDPVLAIDHIITLSSLPTGTYLVSVESDDGLGHVNTDVITLTINNAGSSGGSGIINVRGPVPVVVPSISFLAGSPVAVRDNVLPGDFAILRYDLQLTGGARTFVTFVSADPDFTTPVVAFCGENYDSVANDIEAVLSPVRIVETPVPSAFPPGPGTPATALDCADTNGDPLDGFQYSVYVKMPIASTAIAGAHSATINFGLYP